MNFTIRPMENQDIEETFHWRNDLLVLQNSISQNRVSFPDYEAWILHNNSLKLVFEIDGQRAGFVTVTRDPETLTGEWSFHLNPIFRRKGLSELMLRSAIYYIRINTTYVGLFSRIRHDNNVSHKLHKRLHFQITEVDNDFSKYYLHIG